MRKDNKTYFGCYIKANNKLVVSVSKRYVADLLGVHPITIYRQLQKTNPWITDEYIVWKDVRIIHIKRGFAL